MVRYVVHFREVIGESYQDASSQRQEIDKRSHWCITTSESLETLFNRIRKTIKSRNASNQNIFEEPTTVSFS